jgi:hypothetical protein
MLIPCWGHVTPLTSPSHSMTHHLPHMYVILSLNISSSFHPCILAPSLVPHAYLLHRLPLHNLHFCSNVILLSQLVRPLIHITSTPCHSLLFSHVEFYSTFPMCFYLISCAYFLFPISYSPWLPLLVDMRPSHYILYGRCELLVGLLRQLAYFFSLVLFSRF